MTPLEKARQKGNDIAGIMENLDSMVKRCIDRYSVTYSEALQMVTLAHTMYEAEAQTQALQPISEVMRFDMGEVARQKMEIRKAIERKLIEKLGVTFAEYRGKLGFTPMVRNDEMLEKHIFGRVREVLSLSEEDLFFSQSFGHQGVGTPFTGMQRGDIEPDPKTPA
jgi:hypothetical protein